MLNQLEVAPVRIRESRQRRRAERQGLMLKKYRRRNPRVLDFGMYYIVDPYTNLIVSAERMTLKDVEAYLAD